MFRLSTLLFTAGATLVGQLAKAQSPTLPAADRLRFSQQQYNHSRTIGLSLGGYALANMAASGVAVGQTTGEAHYFHQMNIYWNAVNLGIAGIGLLGLRKQHPETETLTDAVQKNRSLQKVLLVNAGLDVVYVAGGLYLNERGNTHPDQADKLHGYGKAVMAQGAFLLAFDALNYLIARKRGRDLPVRLTSQLPMGVGVTVSIR